jgi:hypothetical protein
MSPPTSGSKKNAEKETSVKTEDTFFHVYFLLGLFVGREDGDHNLYRKVKSVSRLQDVITQKTLPYIATDLRI